MQRPQTRRYQYVLLPIVVSLFCLFPASEGNYGIPYLLYDYRYGFVKRGLLGMTFAGINHLTHFKATAIELSLLTVAFAVIFRAFWPAITSTRGIAQIAAILLCGPTMLPHLAEMFLPTDTVLIALLAGSLLVFLNVEPLQAMMVSLALSLAALLVHEAYLIVLYPTLVCVFLHEWRRGRLRVYAIAFHIGTTVLAFALINHFGALKIDPIVAYGQAQARANFPLDVQLFRLMHQSLAQYRRESMDFVLTSYFMQLYVLSFVFVAPYVYFIVVLLRRCVRACEYPTWHKAVVALACLSPLALVPLATDWPRWGSDCCICASFFVLYLYCAETGDSIVGTAISQFAQDVDLFTWLGYTVALGAFGGMYLSSADRVLKGYFFRVPPGGSPHPGK